jgi:hypothetical protein
MPVPRTTKQRVELPPDLKGRLAAFLAALPSGGDGSGTPTPADAVKAILERALAQLEDEPVDLTAQGLIASLASMYSAARAIALDKARPVNERMNAMKTALTALSLLSDALGYADGSVSWADVERSKLEDIQHKRAVDRSARLVEVEVGAGISLDPWQRRLVVGAASTLVLCGRQVGKTTAAAATALVEMLSNDRAHVVCVSPSLRQSQELFSRIEWLVKKVCPDKVARSTAVGVRLKNGARCVSLPASEHTIRGLSAVTLLLEDEAARVPDDLYAAVRPMLATTSGRHVLLTTPWGPRGHFHDAWTSNSQSWERITVKSSECSRITKEFLDGERMRLGQRWYSQEYECEFVASEDALFGDVLQKVVGSDDQVPVAEEAWLA